FVHRQDEALRLAGRLGLDQPVAVRYAFGDALGRDERPYAEAADDFGKRLGAELGIDCHLSSGPYPASWRGSLKVMCSCAVTTSSATTVRSSPRRATTSRTSSSGAEAPAVMPSVSTPTSHAGSISAPRWM